MLGPEGIATAAGSVIRGAPMPEDVGGYSIDDAASAAASGCRSFSRSRCNRIVLTRQRFRVALVASVQHVQECDLIIS